MIDYVLRCIVTELGAQGLLIIGLYFLLYRPLKQMAVSLRTINHELGEILRILKNTRDNRDNKGE